MSADALKIESAEGFVLAGGSSSRMGRDKSLLIFDGETLLDRAVATLRTVFSSNYVVLNAQQTPPETGLEVVRDRFNGRGAAAGIDAGLAISKSEWCFFLAVDLPFITGDAISRLSAMLSADVDAVVPRQSDGRLQPLSAFYRRETYAPIVTAMLSSGDSPSLRAILREARVLEVDGSSLSTDERLFHNINAPADLRQF